MTYLQSSQGEIVMYSVEIRKDLQGTGIWSNFLRRLMSEPEVNKIVVCGVCRHEMDYSTAKNYIGDNYWINQGGDLVWERDVTKKTRYTGVVMNPERILHSKNRMLMIEKSISAQ